MNARLIYFLISGIGLAALFLVNYFVGVKRGYYKKGEKNFWFDKIMHFCGGFFVAMFWSAFIADFLFVVHFTFLVGIFWEIGEYLYGVYKLKKSGTSEYMTETRDTIEDLICDILGAVALLFLIYNL